MHAKIVEIGNEVRQYRHRDCFKKLCAYIENTDTEKNNGLSSFLVGSSTLIHC